MAYRIQRRDRIGHMTIAPNSASGTSTPKCPANPRRRSGHDHSACASWLSVSSISVAFQISAILRPVSASHAPGFDVMKSSALSVQYPETSPGARRLPSARSASSVASCRSYSGAPRPKRSDW
jgi:hypothetical protein